jgi:acyl-coenzyme A thioesterase PaaI-like protein
MSDPDAAVPEGFERHFRRSPVTDPWEPIFSRRVEGALRIGLRLAEAHCNSRGLVHGAVIAGSRTTPWA